MRLLVQRVSRASVLVKETNIVSGSIERGLCILVGIHREDTKQDVEKGVKKILGLKLFPANIENNIKSKEFSNEEKCLDSISDKLDLNHNDDEKQTNTSPFISDSNGNPKLNKKSDELPVPKKSNFSYNSNKDVIELNQTESQRDKSDTKPLKDGRWALNVKDIGGSILAVSQFTLFARTDKGKKPDFRFALSGTKARDLFDLFVSLIRDSGIPISTGVFGNEMSVSIENDGPITLIIDTHDP